MLCRAHHINLHNKNLSQRAQSYSLSNRDATYCFSPYPRPRPLTAVVRVWSQCTKCYGVLLYCFIWVIPRRLSCVCRSFRTPGLIFIDAVSKRQHIQLRRRGITRKRKYNIHNTVKVWNQQYYGAFNLSRHYRLASALCSEAAHVRVYSVFV
jgi:hypothetical protein